MILQGNFSGRLPRQAGALRCGGNVQVQQGGCGRPVHQVIIGIVVRVPLFLCSTLVLYSCAARAASVTILFVWQLPSLPATDTRPPIPIPIRPRSTRCQSRVEQTARAATVDFPSQPGLSGSMQQPLGNEEALSATLHGRQLAGSEVAIAATGGCVAGWSSSTQPVHLRRHCSVALSGRVAAAAAHPCVHADVPHHIPLVSHRIYSTTDDRTLPAGKISSVKSPPWTTQLSNRPSVSA